MNHQTTSSAFNSPIETGIRAVTVLVAAFPREFDLQRLVVFDHLVVHTGDIGGPPSLHPEIPLRAAELLVRRKLVESGLLLMISRGLAERNVSTDGIKYRAGDLAGTFLSALRSEYIQKMHVRARWVVEKYAEVDDARIRKIMTETFGQWEFQAAQRSLGNDRR